MDNYLFISDAAKAVKVESHVLRYWEEELHLPIKRNELGHRYYTEEDVERFKQIKGMKERGLQLKAIKMILKDGKLDMLVPRQKDGENAEKNENTGKNGNAGQNLNQNIARGIRQSREQNFPGNTAQGAEQNTVQSSSRNMAQYRAQAAAQSTVQNRTQSMAQAGGRNMMPVEDMPIDIVEPKAAEISASDSKEEKSRRLQWLLQQLIRETLQENNGELCREIKESVVKELDYQFRMQEEREEARDRLLVEQSEEHYRKMDELLRRKAKKKILRAKAREKAKEKAETETGKDILELSEESISRDNTSRDNTSRENIPGENFPLDNILDGGSAEKTEKKKKRFIF